MSDDQFTKLFKYMEKRFDGIDERLSAHDQRFDDITAAIGELSAQVKDYHEEVMAMSRQLDRLREAILQIAKETGVKLKYEL